MKRSKIIAILKTLTSLEIRSFGKYIKYKTNSVDLFEFYDYLKKYHPNYPDKDIDKQVIARRLFPKEVNDLKKANNLIVRIKPLLLDFIIQVELEKREVDRAFLLLNGLKSRKLFTLFFREAEQLEKKWSETSEMGIERLFNLYKLNKMKMFPHGLFDEAGFSAHANLIMQQLEQYFFAEKLYRSLGDRFTGDFIKNQQLGNEELTVPMEELIKQTERTHLAENKQISLLAKIFNAIVSNDFGKYEEIELDFYEHYACFNKDEIKELVTYLTQICYKNYQQGNSKALNDLFRINKFAAEQKMLLQDKIIQSDTFHNVVNIALVVNELEWVKFFIEEYSPFLKEDERGDTIILCKAKCHFYSNEFEAAAKLLGKDNLNRLTCFYNLQARALLLQVYFEMEDRFEEFDNAINAFRVYLNNNNTIASPQIESFSNFIKYIKQLYGQKFIKDKKRLNKLQAEITACSLIVNKVWLLNKVTLLSK